MLRQIDKVKVGHARCVCHGHYVRKVGNQMISEFPIHDGNCLRTEKEVLEEGSELHNKATALFALHGETTPEEKAQILRRYGMPFRTFQAGNIKSNYVGRTTVDDQIVGINEDIFFSGELVAIR